MRIWIVVISISLIIFLAGCVKETTTETKFKNDVITIENYIVDDVAPYSDTFTTISFDIQSNSDTKISPVYVNFFDLPGFNVTDLKCPKIKNGDKNLWSTDKKNPACEFTELEPLDARRISITLKAHDVSSPTPYSLSFSISYKHKGSREALIPIIDDITKKEPSFDFSQSDTTLGPIYFDILPQLEREKILDGQTVKVYWGVTGKSFLTKFVMKDASSIKANVKPTNIAKDDIHLTTSKNLNAEGTCDFENEVSRKSVNTTFNTLICNFKPTGTGTEYTATIKLDFTYSYELIKNQNFVVQPLAGGG